MKPEFQQDNFSSSEEEAELEKSVKKPKDISIEKLFKPLRPQVSYKDSLLGDIPGAYAQAFRFDRVEECEVESDTELDELVEGMVDVKLSKDTKSRMRASWTKALIVKVYGKTVGYSEDSDYDKVFHGGPWFIGEHFLAIKPWEPYFKASKATFSLGAVWIRFPKLPIEFYEPSVLREIGSTIGTVLRIDSYTALGLRANYARLCVQIDLSKPLINMIRVGRLRQKVIGLLWDHSVILQEGPTGQAAKGSAIVTFMEFGG
nr:hypothetical protein CFP56_68491 [Quercus suber]